MVVKGDYPVHSCSRYIRGLGNCLLLDQNSETMEAVEHLQRKDSLAGLEPRLTGSSLL